MGFDINEYVEVKDRLVEFYADNPDGGVHTWIERFDGVEIIVGAKLFKHVDHIPDQPVAFGFAHEIAGKTKVNETSFVENCETSAIGRALANLAYQSSAERPSRSEMLKVKRLEMEHDRLLDWIQTMYKHIDEDAEVELDGEKTNLRDFIKTNKTALEERLRLAHDVATQVELVTGERVPTTATEEEE